MFQGPVKKYKNKNENSRVDILLGGLAVCLLPEAWNGNYDSLQLINNSYTYTDVSNATP